MALIAFPCLYFSVFLKICHLCTVRDHTVTEISPSWHLKLRFSLRPFKEHIETMLGCCGVGALYRKPWLGDLETERSWGLGFHFCKATQERQVRKDSQDREHSWDKSHCGDANQLKNSFTSIIHDAANFDLPWIWRKEITGNVCIAVFTVWMSKLEETSRDLVLDLHF